MPEDSPLPPARQPAPRIQQLNALIEELRAMFPRTMNDPGLERRRSVLMAHAYAVRDTLVELEKLSKL